MSLLRFRYACALLLVIACEADRSPSAATLQLAELVEFHPPSDSLDLFFSPNVVEERTGRWLVGPTADESRLLEYDSAGKFLRVVGGAGDGPGEYRRIGPVVTDSAGAVWIFDLALRRLTVLDRDSLTLLYTVPMEFTIGGPPVILSGGRFAHSSIITTTAKFGLPVHISDSAGNILRSLGGESVPDGAMPGLLTHRVVQKAQGGGLWLAHRLAPILERHFLDGTPTEVHTLGVDWFEEPASPAAGGQYAARLDGLLDIGGNRVLVLARRRRARLADGAITAGPRVEGRPIDAGSLGERWESRLLLADLTSNAVAAELLLPGYAVGLQPPDRVVLVRETAEGGMAAELAQVVVN